jgi:Vps16, N-terminal region
MDYFIDGLCQCLDVLFVFNHGYSQWNSGNLLHMGWSNVEDLLCIQDDGTVLVYDLFGSFKRQFSMGQVTNLSTCLINFGIKLICLSIVALVTAF